jgi:uncharacterized membrane protein
MRENLGVRGPFDSAARPHSDRVQRFALCCFTVIAAGLWVARTQLAGIRFVFLWWNLFLAWVPWLVASTLPHLTSRWLFWPAVVLWLTFFPNAPYLVTDLMHLKGRAPVPLWFDVLFLSSFAWAGCALGWDSLALVHRTTTLRWGRWPANAFVVACLGLCGVGVYLGRFVRFNSWDVVTRPAALLQQATTQLLEPRALAFSIVFAAFVGTGYLFSRPVSAT